MRPCSWKQTEPTGRGGHERGGQGRWLGETDAQQQTDRGEDEEDRPEEDQQRAAWDQLEEASARFDSYLRSQPPEC
jgi:hypothetical protein